MEHIEVRYEDLPPTGGSVWVRALSRFHTDPCDMYLDMWLCVWSTDGGNPGRAVFAHNQEFMRATRPAPGIPNPYAHTAAVMAPK
jgi:hypothetical protein